MKDLFKKVTIGLLVLVMVLSIVPADSVAAATKDWQYFRFKGKMETEPSFDPRNYVDVEAAEEMRGSIKKTGASTYDITIYKGVEYYLQCNPTCQWVEEYKDNVDVVDVGRRFGYYGPWESVKKNEYYIACTYDYQPNSHVDVRGADNGRLVISGSIPEDENGNEPEERKETIRVWIAKNGKRVSSKITFNVTVKQRVSKDIWSDYRDKAIAGGKKAKSDIMKAAYAIGYTAAFYQYDLSEVLLSMQEYWVVQANAVQDYPSERYGVCADYASNAAAIAEEIGLQCKYLEVRKMNHAYNIVVIDGKTYLVDTTNNCQEFQGRVSMCPSEIEEVEWAIDYYDYPPLAENDYGELPAKALRVYEKAFEMWPTATYDCYDYEKGEYLEGWIWDARIGSGRMRNDVLDRLLQEYCDEEGIEFGGY